MTYKTAWRMAFQIRKYIAAVDGDSGLSGHVELDETYVGGKEHGAQAFARVTDKKTAVFGMVERGGEIITRVVPNAKSATLLPLVEQYVAKGTVLSSDDWKAYRGLRRLGYKHSYVSHRREWARGETHTNTLEGFWSHFKNSVRGTHKSISRKHMQKYLCEFEFRFNLRSCPWAMFDRLIQAF